MHNFAAHLHLIYLLTLPVITGGTSKSSFCSKKSAAFVLEHEQLIEGGILRKVTVQGIDECIGICKNEPRCDAVNFLLDFSDEPICLLMDSTAPISPAEMPLPAAIIYSAKIICLPNAILCENRQWTFEKHKQYKLLDNKFVLQSFEEQDTDLGDCLDACLDNLKCQAVLYSAKYRSCQLSSIALHSVHREKLYFERDDDVDLYENNCMTADLSLARCHYLRVRNSGFTDVYDIRLRSVPSDDACQRRCLEWIGGTCRSFTYDSETKACYLSHTSGRLLQRNPLNTQNRNLSTGDLDDCLQFDLTCRSNGMSISGQAMKIFTGSLRNKIGPKVFCEKSIENAYDFEVNIGYGECGMEKQLDPFPVYTSSMLLKEGSTELITIRDKFIQANCRLHDNIELESDRKVTFKLDVENDNASKTILTDSIRLPNVARHPGPRPKYKLEVQNLDGSLAEVVNVGDDGYLMIALEQESHESARDFMLSDLIAQDKVTGIALQLIDSDGCVSNRRVIKGLRKPALNKLQLKIAFDGFPDQSEVIYQALLKPCKSDCTPKCNADLWPAETTVRFMTSPPPVPIKRVRRSLDNTRAVSLSEDLYRVRSTGYVMVKQRRDIRKEMDKTLDKVPEQMVHRDEVQKSPVPVTSSSMFGHCFANEMTCLFTVQLVALQFMLFLCCISIVYLYFRQWRRYRTARLLAASNNATVQRELFDENNAIRQDEGNMVKS